MLPDTSPLPERQHQLLGRAPRATGLGQAADVQLAAAAGDREGIAAHADQRRDWRGFLRS